LNFGDADDIFGMFGRVDRMMNSMMRSMNSMMAPGMMMNPIDMLNGTTLTPFGQSFSVSSSPAHGGYSHYSSSMMTYSPDGQVYQQTHSSRSAPGGVRETHSTVRDSRSGLQQMSIGHHIHDRGHVKQRSRNNYTGNQEEVEEFINIEDTEADRFNQEWRQRAQVNSLGGHYYRNRGAIGPAGPTVEPYLALPSSSYVAEPTEITTEPIITEPGDEEPVPVPSPPHSSGPRRARKHKQQAHDKSKWSHKKKSSKHARFE